MAIIGFPRDCLQPRICGTHWDIMSHPNPLFILQISRMIVAIETYMQLNELSSNARFVPVLDYFFMYSNMYQIYLTFYQMYELVLMYIFIRSKLCCKFNVSSAKLTHMLNIQDKFSMSVTIIVGLCNWVVMLWISLRF